MNSWTDSLTRLLTWRGALLSHLHLRSVFVHMSTLLMVPAVALGISAIPYVTSLDGHWNIAAITIPIVWLLSLAARIGAQAMAIGGQSGFEFVVGPTGNLSHEYDRLSGPNMMSYAVAGQSATLILALIGMMVLGASPSSPGLTLAGVLELQTGWHWSAWASQLLWVNSLLFVMHMLPASPFDARALYVGWHQISHPGSSVNAVYRSLSSINSHLGTAGAAFSLAMIFVRWVETQPPGGWYFLLMVSIYLLVVSQIEAYHAHQAEEFLDPPASKLRQRPRLASYPDSPYSKFANFDEDPLDLPSPHEVLDVDEILRKLHREGQESLSAFEKEALLSASRELKARRQS